MSAASEHAHGGSGDLPTLPASTSPSRAESSGSLHQLVDDPGELPPMTYDDDSIPPSDIPSGPRNRRHQHQPPSGEAVPAEAELPATEGDGDHEDRRPVRRPVASGVVSLYRFAVVHLPTALFCASLLALARSPMATRAFVVDRIGDIYAPLASQARNRTMSLNLWGFGADASLCPTLEQSWKLGALEERIRREGCLPSPPSASPLAFLGLGVGAGSEGSGADSMSEEQVDVAVAAKCPSLLQEASEVLFGNSTTTTTTSSRRLSWSQLLTAKRLGVERDASNARGGLISRMLGLLTFTRAMWFLALCGMAATVVPAVAVLAELTGLRRLFAYFGGRFLAFARKALIFIASWALSLLVTNRIARLLHQPLLLALSFLLYVHALSYAPAGTDNAAGYDAAQQGALSMTHVMAALVSCAVVAGFPVPPLWALLPGASARISNGNIRDDYDDRKTFVLCSGRRGIVSVSLYCCVPVLVAAYLGQASLPAYIGLLLLYQSLGFVFAAFGGGYLIGFDGRDSVQRSVLASFVVTVATVAMRLLGLVPSSSELLAKGVASLVLQRGGAAASAGDVGWGLAFFVGPAQTLSTVILFLGLLIMADRHFNRGYHYSYSDEGEGGNGSPYRQYWLAQARMITALVAAAYIGAVYGSGSVQGLSSLFNTALVFAFLYIMDKSVDWDLWAATTAPFLIFACSLSAWRLALFLHTRPEFLLGLFSDEAGRKALSIVTTLNTDEPLFSSVDKGCFVFTGLAFALSAVALLGKRSRF